MIAGSIADLHEDIQRGTDRINIRTAITEHGERVSPSSEFVSRDPDAPNEHDILTGSDSHGRAFPSGLNRIHDFTCNNWTSDSDEDYAMIGHHDGLNGAWNSSHTTSGCSEQNTQAGRFYCFTSD